MSKGNWEVPGWAAGAAKIDAIADSKALRAMPMMPAAEKEDRTQEVIADAILTLRSLKLYLKEIEEKANVCWREMEAEIQALEKGRGKK